VMAKRGFGSPKFSHERQREIARMGGYAVHRKGTAHHWNSDTAAQASDIAALNRQRRKVRER